ncbi:uncharacterized protein LOC125501069 [Athalia rosae]|uniref:uncharacterized protein LOC125501069 n=1 Tax=Athalia rosae TaxID=37344 RepID=UPI0020342EED|nr:uncharacterized protein LOC125501069 [Athalia rosae]
MLKNQLIRYQRKLAIFLVKTCNFNRLRASPLQWHNVSITNDNSTSAISNGGNSADCDGTPGRWPTGKRANFQFHPETEAVMNKQFAMEMKAFYYYLSMVTIIFNYS